MVVLDLPESLNVILKNGLIWHEIVHILIATPFALYIYKKTHQFKSVLVVYFVTLILDIDHLADYFLFYGLNFNLADFLRLEYLGFGKKVDWALVPFHAWEWLVILILINIRKSWKSNWRGVLLGYIPHMIYDYVSVGGVTFYFITYRLIVLERLLP
ncbi:MAG: hypothetical protein UT40_C0006G0035 [Candidatus Woesebacteria bacterium GW2011_GWA1_39_21b]|uniref:Membrane-bound metal-dependent hydrolase n=2 Tax=Candidatus Woeseibacteriota TaxID=1752722 RepID=A0A0G0QUM9_9BACT|nr:MAG: hypothetical protein US72_C0015G0040 [Microgenomates group bacterium GW2011_GWC1_38_12]KKR14045.1 MAG: hypothetical protein UT40_C0006G0035 [Candidatus Woesebacteria bacterium GW2011_GWA1_39_21b]OGM65653.1 MAG: hypothetical protein A3A52_02070 [Candidatus Woesebacteria bacterium RIFCSPLOWO2_01_FULL_39_14]